MIWGEGPERAGLEALRDQLGLGARVDLPGVTARPGQWTEDAGLFVLSSRFESFGNVITEAMASALPVIAFDCPYGPARSCATRSTVVLVPPQDVGALAAALDGLLADPARRALRRGRPRRRPPLRGARAVMAIVGPADRRNHVGAGAGRARQPVSESRLPWARRSRRSADRLRGSDMKRILGLIAGNFLIFGAIVFLVNFVAISIGHVEAWRGAAEDARGRLPNYAGVDWASTIFASSRSWGPSIAPTTAGAGCPTAAGPSTSTRAARGGPSPLRAGRRPAPSPSSAARPCGAAAPTTTNDPVAVRQATP